jgi:hypothetical protein
MFWLQQSGFTTRTVWRRNRMVDGWLGRRMAAAMAVFSALFDGSDLTRFAMLLVGDLISQQLRA